MERHKLGRTYEFTKFEWIIIRSEMLFNAGLFKLQTYANPHIPSFALHSRCIVFSPPLVSSLD